MSKEQAHQILDRYRAGEDYSAELINICLAITGDLLRRL